MSKRQTGDVRDVREDVGSSWRWPDATPTNERPDAPLPDAPLKDDELAGAITRPNVPRWWSFSPSAPDDPRTISAYFENGVATRGPKQMLGSRIHDAVGTGGIESYPHARGRQPVTATLHPDYKEATGHVEPLHREAAAYGVNAAIARHPGKASVGHVVSKNKKSEDRPMRSQTGSGEIDLQLAPNTGASSGIGAGATGAVMEHAAGGQVMARATGDTAAIRETTGKVVGPAWRQYRSPSPASPPRRRSGYSFPVDTYERYDVRTGIPITAREARENDTNLRLVAVAISGCPTRDDAPGRQTTGAVQGIGQDDALAARVQEQLAAWQPASVVTVVATPGDLLVAEAAKSLHMTLGLVLPMREATIRARLVAARGEAWGDRFDRLLAHVRSTAAGSVFSGVGYDACAGRALNEALALARARVGISQTPTGVVRAICITDGAGGPPPARDLARAALVAGVEIETISAAGLGGGGVR